MTTVFKRATETRVLVGYLAEQHAKWFSSQFFGPRASAFLSPVFGRSAFQAQCCGVTSASARLHDEAIGIGRTYHLFRFPEILEQGVNSALSEPVFAKQLQQKLTSSESAFGCLQSLAAPCQAIEGVQILVGNFEEGAEELLRTLAGVYLDALTRGIKSFPFVREG